MAKGIQPYNLKTLPAKRPYQRSDLITLIRKNTMCELIKRRQRNDKTRFSCFHDAKIQHRKSSFWAWVGFVAKKLGKSGFGRFRWVSAFIIYINIYIIF